MQNYIRLAFFLLSISVLASSATPDKWKLFFKKHGQGTPLISDNPANVFRTKHAENGKIEHVDVTGMPFKQAVRFTVVRRPRRAYMVQTVALTESPIANGSVVVASFFARTVSTVDESGYGQLAWHVGITHKPWTSWNKWQDSIGTEWKEYHLPVVVGSKNGPECYEPGSARLSFNAGFAPQVVELGGVRFRNYGNDVSPKDLPKLEITYEGREPTAAWRKPARERIEKHRKAELRVVVKDQTGKPVPNARIKVEMTRHAFPFGAAFNAKWYHANKDTSDAKRYLQTYRDNFSRVSHIGLLKWAHWQANRKLALESVSFLVEQGFEVRGHCLIWPRWDRLPWDGDTEFIAKMEADHPAWKKLLTDHIRDEVGALKGKTVEWDVYNEPYSHYHFPEKLGDEVMLDWYRTAKAVDPAPTLFLNEGGHLSRCDLDSPITRNYDRLVTYLLDNGAPLEGIGFESHFGWRVPHPQKVYDTIEHFARFGLPIGITEFDQVVDDETLQADWERDFLTIVFSHPAVTEFIRWGVWNGISKRGFINKDWSLKPNGRVWRDLVFKQWWTNEDGATNPDGIFRRRAFLGDYRISVSNANAARTVKTTLPKGGRNLVVTLP
jgi:GH35 family endo-1,4-beta-xylanase